MIPPIDKTIALRVSSQCI